MSIHVNAAPLLLVLSILLVLGACGNESEVTGSGGPVKTGVAVWKKLEKLKHPRMAPAVVKVAGHIYALGGSDEKGYLSSCERTKLRDDGTLEPWKKIYSLNEPRGYAAAISHKGFVYVLGGANGEHGFNLLSTVERAKVTPDGSIGRWVVEKNKLFSRRRGTTAAVLGDYLYAIGGYNGEFLDTVERTKIGPDGTLGEWELVSIMLERRYIHSSVFAHGRLYVIAGHERGSGGALDDVEFTQTDSAGEISEWQEAPTLRVPRYGAGAIENNGHIFVLGGFDGNDIDSVERASINPDGSLTPWKMVSTLPRPLNSPGVVTDGGILYVIGGSSGNRYFPDIEATAIDYNGEFTSW